MATTERATEQSGNKSQGEARAEAVDETTDGDHNSGTNHDGPKIEEIKAQIADVQIRSQRFLDQAQPIGSPRQRGGHGKRRHHDVDPTIVEECWCLHDWRKQGLSLNSSRHRQTHGSGEGNGGDNLVGFLLHGTLVRRG
jgi:hypothetical protein